MWIELGKVFNCLNLFKENEKEILNFIKAAADEGKLTEVNLTTVMNTWTKQMGHPLITIERLNENSIRISQKHFLLDPSSPPTEVSPYK